MLKIYKNQEFHDFLSIILEGSRKTYSATDNSKNIVYDENNVEEYVSGKDIEEIDDWFL